MKLSQQLRQTMARLQTVVNERKKIRDDYRNKLEEEYIAAQRVVYEKKLAEEENAKSLEPEVPEITFNLLRAKYRDLKRGIDNTNYIKEALEIKHKKEAEKKYLDEKYDYKNKKIVKLEEEKEGALENDAIIGFKSGILNQLNTGRYKISQDEVLRSHIKNWKMLSLKDKRIVLGKLNARRARDAKSEFLKELNLLGQKIAYDNLQEQRTAKANPAQCD